MDLVLRDGWREFLSSLEWDFFLTFTFRDFVPKHRGLNTLYFVERSLKRFAPHHIFLGLEEHLSGYMHMHGLYRQCETTPLGQGESMAIADKSYVPAAREHSTSIFQNLFQTYGRCKIEIPRSHDDVVEYVTKYATKNLADYSFF